VSDDYLWDRSGAPDPEIEGLERALAPLRGSDRPRRALELAWVPADAAPNGAPVASVGGSVPAAAVAPVPRDVVASAPRVRRRWMLVSGLAVAGAAGAAAVRVRGERKPVPAPSAHAPPLAGEAPGGWGLTLVTGRPHVDGRPLDGQARQAQLAIGQTLETDASSRARLEVPGVGYVQIDPRTRVRLLGTGAKAHRLSLAGGVLHATIFAPPGTFFIETPAGVAIDLGCVYSVEVGPEGDGLITVQVGWVGFQQGGRESFIPQGAFCAIRMRNGPGTPCFLDSSAGFRNALTTFDTSGAPRDQVRALRTLLAEARARDAVTLWHLLERAPPEARSRVLARLQALVPAAAAVATTRVLAGERKALEELWDRLDLGPIALWRQWRADLDRNPGR
jgi:hypothetical protein